MRHRDQIVSQPLMRGIAGIAFMPQHIDMYRRGFKRQFCPDQRVGHAGGRNQVSWLDRQQVRVSNHAACCKKLVDGQQYASFTPHFAQSFINQTVRSSRKTH